MEVKWITAFIDLGADVFDSGVAFWSAVTGSTMSPRRGADDEFATFLPATGDPYLRVQRTADGTSDVHLDLHVESIVAARDNAVELGASVTFEDGYAVMKSPGGFAFCLVSHHGESVVGQPVAEPARHSLDQVSIDIPPDLFEAEAMFWSSLTGWARHQSTLPEFVPLDRPAGIPLRILLQRLDGVEADEATHAHLDIACGDNIDAVAAHHERLGATNLGRTKRWLPMNDPTGRPYCLTPREPRAGDPRPA